MSSLTKRSVIIGVCMLFAPLCHAQWTCGGPVSPSQEIVPAGGGTIWGFGNEAGDSQHMFVPMPQANGNRGLVDVFVRSGGAWQRSQTLSIAGATSSDMFGSSGVSVAGDWAVIGGRVYLGGAAYFYKREGGLWNLKQQINGSGGWFGYRLGTDGNRAIIGQNGMISTPSPVRIYVRSGDTWSLEQQLPYPAGDITSFGTQQAIDGDSALVVSGWPRVRFHIYQRVGGTWSVAQTLEEPSFNAWPMLPNFTKTRLLIPITSGSTSTIRIYERTSESVPFTTYRTIVSQALAGYYLHLHGNRVAIGIQTPSGIGAEVWDIAPNLPVKVLTTSPMGLQVADYCQPKLAGDFLFLIGPRSDGSWRVQSVEYGGDCNADGLWDRSQICRGLVADLDANGVPDVCETPCDFATGPAPTTIVPGGDAAFSAAFARAGHSLQWRRNGVNLSESSRLSGVTSPTLTIRQVAAADQGTYDCVATGPCGSVPSAGAELSCKARITEQPQGGTFVGGQPLTLSVVAQGTAGATYRWRRDGVSLFNGIIHQGVTTPTLTIIADEPAQSGTYTVAITNACGTIISAAATIEVTCPSDFNNDGGIDGQDLFEFFDAWAGGLSNADLNFDGGTDGSDVTAFFVRWENGC